jgi:hypothetical protein
LTRGAADKRVNRSRQEITEQVALLPDGTREMLLAERETVDQ